MAEADELLGGGFPVGGLSELVGASCSGRTSLALALIAEVARSGGVSAWIDAADALDPESAGAAGVDLAKLLWVRCGGSPSDEASAPEPSMSSRLLCDEKLQVAASGSGGSPHPRAESRGMPEAIKVILQHEHWGTSENLGVPAEDVAVLHTVSKPAHGNAGEHRRARKKLATPGMPNRPLSRMSDREEQPPTDRMPSRRSTHVDPHPAVTRFQTAETPLLCLATRQLRAFNEPQEEFAARQERVPIRKNTWQPLDQALRAVDLLLNAGGFGALVLDLGSTPPEMAWRIPLRMKRQCSREFGAKRLSPGNALNR